MRNFKKMLFGILLMFCFFVPLMTACEKDVSSFTVMSGTLDTELDYNEEIDFEDLEILLNFADGTTSIVKYADVQDEFLFDTDELDILLAGEYEVTITYKGNEISVVVTVLAPQIVGFEIDTDNMDLIVGHGSIPIWDNLIVNAVYADGRRVALESGYLIDATTFNPNIAEIYTINVGYQNFTTTSFEVEVLSATEDTLQLDLTNVELDYGYGETPNFENLIVRSVFSDNSTQTVVNYDISYEEGYSITSPGTYTVTITKGSLTKTFEITIASPVITRFEIDTSSIPATISYGSNVDWASLVVKAIYEDDSIEILNTEDYILNYSTFDNQELGTYTISVGYGSFSSQTFTISVISPNSNGHTFAYDGDTLILFKGAEYTFNVSNLTYTGEDSVTTEVEGTTLILNQLGHYRLDYEKEGVPTSKEIRVVPWISTFGVGAGITNYLSNTGVNSTFLDSTNVKAFTVGYQNEFYFDVVMNSSFVTDESFINFSYKVYDETTQDYITAEDLVTSSTKSDIYGVGILFNPTFVGKTIRVTIEPKYNDRTPISFEFVLNDGVNVYNDAELKSAYGDLSVQSINILRTITVTLSENQTNPDGSPLNYMYLTGRVAYDGDTLTANNTGNPYVRYSESKTGDNLVISGNYQTIDASGLKLINPAYLGVGGQVDSLLSGSVENDNAVVSSQIAIFRSEVRDASLTTATTSADFNTLNNNKINYNNLLVIGNTVTPDTTQGNELYENAGSHSAIRSEYTDVTTNNCILKNVCIGLYFISSGTDMTANYTKIYETWANDIYGYASNVLTISNGYLGSAGGSAIWLTDTNISDDELNNPKVVIDLNTTINNLVAGTEAWFTAKDMASIVTGFKSIIEGNVNPVGKTILQHFNYNGQPVEKFNFTVVIHEDFGDTVPDGEMTGTMQIGNIIVSRTNTSVPGADAIKCEPTLLALPAFAAKVAEYYSYYHTVLGHEEATASQEAQAAAYVFFSTYLEVVYPVPTVGTVHILMSLYPYTAPI